MRQRYFLNKYKHSNRPVSKAGFSLLEIIMSIAIITILVLSLIPAITEGYLWLIRSGHENKAMFTAQTGAELILNGNVYDNSEGTEKYLVLTFGSQQISVDGHVYKLTVPIDSDPSGRSTELEIFKP